MALYGFASVCCQCHKAIITGGLPCPVDDAIYLGALQLYIEVSPLSTTGIAALFMY